MSVGMAMWTPNGEDPVQQRRERLRRERRYGVLLMSPDALVLQLTTGLLEVIGLPEGCIFDDWMFAKDSNGDYTQLLVRVLHESFEPVSCETPEVCRTSITFWRLRFEPARRRLK